MLKSTPNERFGARDVLRHPDEDTRSTQTLLGLLLSAATLQRGGFPWVRSSDLISSPPNN